MSKINHTPEAVALACGIVGQAKGDIPAARRACGDAYSWLASVDTATPAAQVAQLALPAELAQAQAAPAKVAPAADDGKIRADLVQAQNSIRDLSKNLTKSEAEHARLRIALDDAGTAHAREVAVLRSKIARLAGLDDTPAAPVAPVQVAPVQVAAPAPINGAVAPGVAKWLAANGAKG